MSFCARCEQYGADALAWPGQGKNLKPFFFLSTLFSFFSAPKPPDPRNLARTSAFFCFFRHNFRTFRHTYQTIKKYWAIGHLRRSKLVQFAFHLLTPQQSSDFYLRSSAGYLGEKNMQKLFYFVWSPPWHLYILLLTYLLVFYLAYLLAVYLAYLLAFYLVYLLAFYLTFYLAYLLAFYLAVEVQRCTLSWAGPTLRSSGAHWAGKVPGWGPAVHTELGRSQVEVQQCTLSWEGPRLRSSGAHWAGQVPGWGPAVPTELGSWRRAWRRVGKAEVKVEVDADMVEEKLEEEEEEEAEEEES